METFALPVPKPFSLAALFKALNLTYSGADVWVNNVQNNSQAIQVGDLFIALPGARAQGTDYLKQAIQHGAVAALVDESLWHTPDRLEVADSIRLFSVPNLSHSLSQLADIIYEHPSQKLHIIGVTGTNGKSTTVSLLEQLLNGRGLNSAMMGTLGVNHRNQKLFDFGMTTPDALLCQKILAGLGQQKIEWLAMEVSSHGLDQKRVEVVAFEAAIFTNLSHDHLDYHGNLETYARVKQTLFEKNTLQAAIINVDDPRGEQMIAAAKHNQVKHIIRYGLINEADVTATDIRYFSHGIEFKLCSPWGEIECESPLLGEFNIYNLLAAVSAVSWQGWPMESLIGLIKQLKPVPGRMQGLPGTHDISVVVDYAHTPDALAQAISATRVHTSGRLWVIFGCGGDRDKTKRSLMASVAERFADKVVITTDNPRTESPDAILNHIKAGFEKIQPIVQLDRYQAIVQSILQAQPGDTLLIAGKGHENYQIIGTQVHPFSDVDVAQTALLMRSNHPLKSDYANQ